MPPTPHNPAEQDDLTEKRTYAAALLRKLAEMTDEIDHAVLPHADGALAIADLVEVGGWLYGAAIRVENGALD